MDLKSRLLTDTSTGLKLDYNKWCFDNKLHELFGLTLNEKEDVEKKIEKGLYQSVDQNNQIPLSPEFDDLTRLHFITRNRRVTTVMEFGLGKSSSVFADALRLNKENYNEFVVNNLRRAHPFELYSIDNSEKWINSCKTEMPAGLKQFVTFHFSEVEMTTFNDRACTMYQILPNICPDLIYLDGPEQFNVLGNIRGISTNTVDRLPMAADILLIEPFLLPGTLIIVDGRTANARFLLNNLQRNWEYCHLEEEDIHAFELIETPLGKINALQIEFSNQTDKVTSAEF
jgi:hypothetical protein